MPLIYICLSKPGFNNFFCIAQENLGVAHCLFSYAALFYTSGVQPEWFGCQRFSKNLFPSHTNNKQVLAF